ncbi:MAG: hypothetical protein QM767_18945 [Anaeromyxobacter sp.]
MPRNLCIEFHDSTVHGIRMAGPDAIVEISVYVHSSAGVPGVDPGLGWFQAAELILSEGVIEHAPSGFPLALFDGVLAIDSDRFDDGPPLPLDRAGQVRLELQGNSELVMVGTRIRCELRGAPGEPEET